MIAEVGQRGVPAATGQQEQERQIADGGTAVDITPSEEHIPLYECDTNVTKASGDTAAVEGFGKIILVIQSSGRNVQLTLTQVAHVPML